MSTTQITIYLPKKVHKAMKIKLKIQENKTLKDIVLHLLNKYLIIDNFQLDLNQIEVGAKSKTTVEIPESLLKEVDEKMKKENIDKRTLLIQYLAKLHLSGKL